MSVVVLVVASRGGEECNKDQERSGLRDSPRYHNTERQLGCVVAGLDPQKPKP